MNKRGVEQVISVYWFAILIIVAVGVSAMVFTFYSHPYDVREVEANILMNKIADCISEMGTINPLLIDSQGVIKKDLDLTKICGLNFEVVGYEKVHEQYYVFVKFSDLQGNELENMSAGNNNLRPLCLGQEEEKDEARLPKCSKGNLVTTHLATRKDYSIEIITGVLKAKQNVKI